MLTADIGVAARRLVDIDESSQTGVGTGTMRRRRQLAADVNLFLYDAPGVARTRAQPS
jgi:hypothetical protein